MAVFPYTNIQLQGMEVKEIYSITSEKNKETKNEFSLIHEPFIRIEVSAMKIKAAIILL